MLSYLTQDRDRTRGVPNKHIIEILDVEIVGNLFDIFEIMLNTKAFNNQFKTMFKIFKNMIENHNPGFVTLFMLRFKSAMAEAKTFCEKVITP